MKFRILLLIVTLAFLHEGKAQKLTVESMKSTPMDLSASQSERKDLAGKPCALVKVQLAATGAQFEGNVIGQVEYKTGEYWVYMSEGSYMLTIKHPNYVPLDANFRSYGIDGVQGKMTYKLTLQTQQTQKLTINYSPVNAIVVVDSKSYQGNGHLELTLPIGTHDYQIVAMGYDAVEGSVKLNASSPRIITEHLIANQQETVAQIEPLPQTQVSVQQDLGREKVQSINSSTSQSQGIETITVKGVSFNMVRVEGGTFQIGSNDSEAFDNEKPVHQVTLSTYSIGETEVTQALWEAVMGSNPSTFKGTNLPVEQVSWEDCQEFISKLNSLTGRQFRLPTEAEWEFAARGGTKSRNYKYSGSNTIGDVAWYDGNSGGKTHPVKSKQANELGIYDMSGNVWELCQDWYSRYRSGAQTNPMGTSPRSSRVYRGGGWINNGRYCRSSYRGNLTSSFRYYVLGFRLAL